MKRGKFITIEGIEGVGKSSNLDFIRDFVASLGHEVVITREPGGTPLAEQIRELVLNTGCDLLPQSEMLLMFAARSANVDGLIRPALEKGQWVICDRFTDATIAYQGYGRGVDLEQILALADMVHGDLWPDLTLLLDAPVEIGRERAARRSEPDRFEREKQEFFEKVRRGYLHQASGPRVRLIDARPGLESVQKQIAEELSNFVGRLDD